MTPFNPGKCLGPVPTEWVNHNKPYLSKAGIRNMEVITKYDSGLYRALDRKWGTITYFKYNDIFDIRIILQRFIDGEIISHTTDTTYGYHIEYANGAIVFNNTSRLCRRVRGYTVWEVISEG